jgi:sulfide dehydrogenase [flavocytochrome c] flavoprotein subunit
MMDQTRRNLIKCAAATAAAVGVGFPLIGRAAPKARVVVVGGGYCGAIAAKYLQMADPDIRVTLIEQNPS